MPEQFVRLSGGVAEVTITTDLLRTEGWLDSELRPGPSPAGLWIEPDSEPDKIWKYALVNR